MKIRVNGLGGLSIAVRTTEHAFWQLLNETNNNFG